MAALHFYTIGQDSSVAKAVLRHVLGFVVSLVPFKDSLVHS